MYENVHLELTVGKQQLSVQRLISCLMTYINVYSFVKLRNYSIACVNIFHPTSILSLLFIHFSSS